VSQLRNDTHRVFAYGWRMLCWPVGSGASDGSSAAYKLGRTTLTVVA